MRSNVWAKRWPPVASVEVPAQKDATERRRKLPLRNRQFLHFRLVAICDETNTTHTNEHWSPSMTLDRRQILLGTAALSLLTLAGCSDGGSANAQTAAPESQGTVDLDALMAEQPLPDVIEGDANAPVTIIEYASMTCGHCAAFHNETYPAIKEKYVDTGQVRFILREFPFDARAAAAFMLGRCAPNDNRAALISAMFETQNDWARAENGREALFALAEPAGFTQEAFETCLTDQELLDKVMATFKQGQELGVEATPTFFIGDQKYSGNLSVDAMSAIIDQQLAG